MTDECKTFDAKQNRRMFLNEKWPINDECGC